MALFAAIALAPPMLKDDNFLAALLRHNLGFYPCASDNGCPDRHLRALPNELHMGEGNRITNGTCEFFNLYPVAWTDSILPITRGHHRVHMSSFALRRAITAGTSLGQALARYAKSEL